MRAIKAAHDIKTVTEKTDRNVPPRYLVKEECFFIVASRESLLDTDDGEDGTAFFVVVGITGL